MNYHIEIQHACEETTPVDDESLISWVKLALVEHMESAELTIRLVSQKEITLLNHKYRHQNKPTNVLAFPSTIPTAIPLEYPLLGDVIICPSVLQNESQLLDKPLIEHWAHITIHGILHLLGYDHLQDHDTATMQELEIKLLARLGFENPYQLQEDNIEQKK